MAKRWSGQKPLVNWSSTTDQGYGPDDPRYYGTLKAWYKFDDLSTIWQDTGRTSPVTTLGQSIAGVTDKSGSNNHLRSNTTAPVYAAAGASFNGTNQSLRATIVTQSIWNFLHNAGGHTVFMHLVCDTSTANGTYYATDDTDNGAPTGVLAVVAATSLGYLIANGGKASPVILLQSAGGEMPTNTACVFSSRFNYLGTGDDGEIRINNVVAISGESQSTPAPVFSANRALRVGCNAKSTSGDFYKGTIRQMYFYEGPLSDAYMTALASLIVL